MGKAEPPSHPLTLILILAHVLWRGVYGRRFYDVLVLHSRGLVTLAQAELAAGPAGQPGSGAAADACISIPDIHMRVTGEGMAAALHALSDA